MVWVLIILMALAGAPALAQNHDAHGGEAATAMHEHAHHGAGADEKHRHGSHESSGGKTAEDGEDAPLLKRNEAINAALSEGGEPVVVDVLGVVCDFCAKAMNRTFGKRQEVAAVYVDLDDKTLNLVVRQGAVLNDGDIEKLAKKAGYRIAAIRRGAVALGATAP